MHSRANTLASPGRRSPFFMYSMGPPRKLPSGPRSRWRTASVFSPQLTAMPSRADIHIQNTAPGPPYTMAVATPAMEPVPIVAARAVDRAWSWVTPPPLPAFFRRSREPTVVLHHTPTPKMGKKPVAKEYHSPTAKKAASSGPPHRKLPSSSKKAMSAFPLKGRYADMAFVMRFWGAVTPPRGPPPPPRALFSAPSTPAFSKAAGAPPGRAGSPCGGEWAAARRTAPPASPSGWAA